MHTVQLENVSKAYGLENNLELLALEGIDFIVREGEFVSILGPSGCGKSTLLRLIAGLDQPVEGKVWMNGRIVDRPATDVGLVFQDPTLLDWRRVFENVMIQIDIRRLPRERYRERAAKLLEMLGLSGFERSYPSQLSGGLRQRVGIARALVHNPPLLLMDEPFSALDALTRDRLNIDLQEVWSTEGKTVVFITHNISEAVFLSDRVIVMTPSPGRIAEVLDIDLPRPRTLEGRETPAFTAFVGKIISTFRKTGVL